MSAYTLPEPAPNWALFLDFDGTLVELQPHPDMVRPAPLLGATLDRLAALLHGAVAIVSGRSLDDLDRFLNGTALPMAGVHGLERRDAEGAVHRPLDHTESFQAARATLARFVAEHPGTHYEDKGNSLALHFRNAPGYAAQAEAALRAECQRMGEEFEVQRGKSVMELKPTGHHKGTVVATFLEEPPFRGRVPVFIGDDVTDEDAFSVVVERGGHAIRVGDLTATHATCRIGSVEEVLEWLTTVIRTLERSATSTR